jgi:hypothetical protein
MSWPTECPKCGAGISNMWPYGPFKVRYCNGDPCARQPLNDDGEHLHLICRRCKIHIPTPCKDAGEEPAK